MLQITPQKLIQTTPIGIIVSQFNPLITQELLSGALARLKELAWDSNHIIVIWVPGAVEIGLAAQRLARTHQVETIIALGAVIRGETSHYDYVCQQVSYACQKVSLENNLPVIFGILTTDTEEQALSRLGGVHGHKGRDAVDAALEMISVLQQLEKN